MGRIWTSRYSNKELRTGNYTAVRISLGTPRWPLGYTLTGAIRELMPWGCKGIEDTSLFKEKYFINLEKAGVACINKQLRCFESLGKDVVLLCYEDIRKGPSNWCHRTMFAEWWLKKTGETILELRDESTFKPEVGVALQQQNIEELSLF